MSRHRGVYLSLDYDKKKKKTNKILPIPTDRVVFRYIKKKNYIIFGSRIKTIRKRFGDGDRENTVVGQQRDRQFFYACEKREHYHKIKFQTIRVELVPS